MAKATPRGTVQLQQTAVSALANTAAEINVLSVLVWADAKDVDKMWILNSLEAVDFGSKERRIIFQAVVAVNERGQEIDPFTVQDELKRHGIDNPIQFFYDWIGDDQTAAMSNYRIFVEAVLDSSRRRTLTLAADRFRRQLSDGHLDLAELCAEFRDRVADIHIPTSIHPGLHLYNLIDQIHLEYGKEKGMTFRTGYPSIDSTIGGFKRGEMVLAVGRPKCGKTWLLLNLVANLLADGRKVLLTSGEISAKELTAKLLCRLAGVNHKLYRMECMSEEQHERFVKASEKLAKTELMVLPKRDAPSIPKILNCAMEFKPDVVAIDAVYLYSPKAQIDGWEYYVAMSREIKNMSTQTGALVLCTHQKSKTGDPAYSDAFWQDSNFMLSLDNEPLGPKSWLTIKGRDGETFRFKLHVDFDRSLVWEMVADTSAF